MTTEASNIHKHARCEYSGSIWTVFLTSSKRVVLQQWQPGLYVRRSLSPTEAVRVIDGHRSMIDPSQFS